MNLIELTEECLVFKGILSDFYGDYMSTNEKTGYTGNIRYNSQTRYVSLGLTNNCNLNCVYCYERNKDERSMDRDTIDRIIDDEIHLVSSGDVYEALEIQPFGGEPFIEFDLIKHLTNKIRQSNADFPIVVFITTNGTLVHNDVQKWLDENRDLVICGLSLDGTKEMQDINRSNSYDLIDFEFFRSRYPDQPIKMTISKETLPNLAEGVIHCHNLGFGIECNLAYGLDFSDASYKDILEKQLEILVDYYLEHPDIIPCSMLNRSVSFNDKKSDTRKRWCGAGSSTVSYDIHGLKYPCQFFQPITLGDKAEEMKDMKFQKEFSAELLDEKCRNCPVEPCCPTCCGQNYLSTGNIYKRSDDLCILTKVTLKARMYLMVESWKRGHLHYTEEEQAYLLDNIIKITESGVLDEF